MRFDLCHGIFLSVSFLIYIAIADLHWPNGFPWGKALGVRISVSFPPAIPTYKKILPSRVLGREQFHASWCHPNSEIPLEFPSLAQKSGLRGPAISVRCTLYACSADVLPGAAAKAFQQSGFLSGQRGSRYCFRVVAVYRIDFLFFIMMRQSRSPRCSPRISISAVARLVAQGTLYVSHRRSVRMMR